jgi:hypothetical protein
LCGFRSVYRKHLCYFTPRCLRTMSFFDHKRGVRRPVGEGLYAPPTPNQGGFSKWEAHIIYKHIDLKQQNENRRMNLVNVRLVNM